MIVVLVYMSTNFKIRKKYRTVLYEINSLDIGDCYNNIYIAIYSRTHTSDMKTFRLDFQKANASEFIENSTTRIMIYLTALNFELQYTVLGC